MCYREKQAFVKGCQKECVSKTSQLADHGPIKIHFSHLNSSDQKIVDHQLGGGGYVNFKNIEKHFGLYVKV